MIADPAPRLPNLSAALIALLGLAKTQPMSFCGLVAHERDGRIVLVAKTPIGGDVEVGTIDRGPGGPLEDLRRSSRASGGTAGESADGGPR